MGKLVGLLLRALDYSCQANRKTREGLAAATEPAAKRYSAQVQVGESPWNTIDRTRVDAATIERTPPPARLIEPVLKAAVVLVIGVMFPAMTTPVG